MLAVIVFLIAFFGTFAVTPLIMKGAKKAGIVGRDMHKEGKPFVPELGGLGIAAGIIAALLFSLAANSFTTLKTIFDGGNVIYLFAALSVILLIELIGFMDDILNIRQRTKFLLPIIAALPLMAAKVISPHALTIPLFGGIDFVTPIIYVLILIPIGITAATNLTNVFAGFNGLEAGMGAVAAAALLWVGYSVGSIEVMVLSAALLGSLLAFLVFNWYPAKVFPDDVGNLLIGGVIATAVILGGIEVAGVVLLLPHIVDFLFFKLPNRLPSRGWWGELKEGRLYCNGKPVHLAQYVMKVFGGIEEKKLVLLFIGIEVVLALVVVLIYS